MGHLYQGKVFHEAEANNSLFNNPLAGNFLKMWFIKVVYCSKKWVFRHTPYPFGDVTKVRATVQGPSPTLFPLAFVVFRSVKNQNKSKQPKLHFRMLLSQVHILLRVAQAIYAQQMQPLMGVQTQTPSPWRMKMVNGGLQNWRKRRVLRKYWSTQYHGLSKWVYTTVLR